MKHNIKKNIFLALTSIFAFGVILEDLTVWATSPPNLYPSSQTQTESGIWYNHTFNEYEINQGAPPDTSTIDTTGNVFGYIGMAQEGTNDINIDADTAGVVDLKVIDPEIINVTVTTSLPFVLVSNSVTQTKWEDIAEPDNQIREANILMAPIGKIENNNATMKGNLSVTVSEFIDETLQEQAKGSPLKTSSGDGGGNVGDVATLKTNTEVNGPNKYTLKMKGTKNDGSEAVAGDSFFGLNIGLHANTTRDQKMGELSKGEAGWFTLSGSATEDFYKNYAYDETEWQYGPSGAADVEKNPLGYYKVVYKFEIVPPAVP